MRTNITIIGAVKRRNIDVALAVGRRLQMHVLDCDGYIEYEFGLNIHQMIADFGKEYFYRLESKKLAQLDGYDNSLLATSPTCLTSIENVVNMAKFSYIITLFESEESAHNGISEDGSLPLRDDVMSNFETVYNNFCLVADQLSHVVIDVTGLAESEIVDRILIGLDDIF